MGKITFTLPDDIESQLRSIVPNRKGALGATLTEAVKMLLKKKGEGRRSK